MGTTHSAARVVPSRHPLAGALKCLAKLDRETCEYANVKHDPDLFRCRHSKKKQLVWDRPFWVSLWKALQIRGL